MKGKINEEVLCVLKKNNANQIVIGYVDIVNPLKTIVNELAKLCDNPRTNIQQIVSYIQNTKEFEQLTAHYSYCVLLNGTKEGVSANNENFIKKINEKHQSFLIEKKENADTFNLEVAISRLKSEIKNQYFLWSKAFAINKTYRICQAEKRILTYSHRRHGWSAPEYQLTPNFSVEIRTNFGYGRASYFYTKFKYKNIQIIPFSDWINYEYARFSEIIRYTQSHFLDNNSWLEAMEFCREACNISLTDEVKFVEKYVIDECEKMVYGLEDLLKKEKFNFNYRDKRKYSVDKKGHELIEYRGEKISGALDLISKILEFDRISDIKTFIQRIEDCNREIQPILVDEAKNIKIEIEELTKKKNQLQPQYDEVVRIEIDYNAKRNKLEAEMISQGELNAILDNTQKLEKEFNCRYPDYYKFKQKHKQVTGSYRAVTEQINNNTKIRDNILLYKNKVKKHFLEKNGANKHVPE